MALKFRTWEWDFAVEGGAVGTIELTRGFATGGVKRRGGLIPAGAIVVSAAVEIITDLTCTPTSTVTVVIPGLDNHASLNAVDPTTLDAAEVFLVPMPVAYSALAAADNPQLVIATETVTAGKLRITAAYVE